MVFDPILRDEGDSHDSTHPHGDLAGALDPGKWPLAPGDHGPGPGSLRQEQLRGLALQPGEPLLPAVEAQTEAPSPGRPARRRPRTSAGDLQHRAATLLLQPANGLLLLLPDSG